MNVLDTVLFSQLARKSSILRRTVFWIRVYEWFITKKWSISIGTQTRYSSQVDYTLFENNRNSSKNMIYNISSLLFRSVIRGGREHFGTDRKPQKQTGVWTATCIIYFRIILLNSPERIKYTYYRHDEYIYIYIYRNGLGLMGIFSVSSN